MYICILISDDVEGFFDSDAHNAHNALLNIHTDFIQMTTL